MSVKKTPPYQAQSTESFLLFNTQHSIDTFNRGEAHHWFIRWYFNGPPKKIESDILMQNFSAHEAFERSSADLFLEQMIFNNPSSWISFWEI